MTRRFCSLVTAIFSIVLISATAASAQQVFHATLNPIQENPPTASQGRGFCTIILNAAETQITVNCTFSNLTTNLTAGHIHGNAAPGANAGVLIDLTPPTGVTSGMFTRGPLAITAAQVTAMRSKLLYVNLHTMQFGGGEIRGQIKIATTVSDFEGDSRSDITVFRQSDNTFYSLWSINNSIVQTRFGSGTGDIFLNNTADFDGDGRTDPLLLKLVNNILYWSILQTGTNTVRTVPWGNFAAGTGETLAIGDYDGDGAQDIAVFRRSTGVWYILQSSNGASRVEVFGAVNDFPSVGDYDKDGGADLCAVRQESGQFVWYIRNSSNGQTQRIPWGTTATDNLFFFAQIDVDGDGAQDILVSRVVGGARQYFVRQSSNGQTFFLQWGLGTDTQLFGDYDGDGKTDFVARRNEGGTWVWYIYQSSNGQGRRVPFGLATDQFASEPTLPVGSEEAGIF